MSDILELATEISQTKETIRQAIENQGISCSTSVPFEQYPNKIFQIAKENIWVKNDLVEEPEKDKKVWVTPIDYNSETYYKFMSTADFSYYKMLYLVPIQGYECLLQSRAQESKCQLYSLDPQTGNLTAISNTQVYDTNYTDTAYSNAGINSTVIFPSPYIIINYSKTFSQSSSYTSDFCPASIVVPYNTENNQTYSGNNATKYLNFGWALTYNSSDSLWYLKKYNLTTGVIDSSTSYGSLPSGSLNTRYPQGKIIITRDGKTIYISTGSTSNITSFTKYKYNEDLRLFESKGGAGSIKENTHTYYLHMGSTIDDKYAIVCYYTSQNGAIYQINNGNSSISLVSPVPSGYTYSWYEHNQTLFMVIENKIHMYKYDTISGFVEYEIDTGNIIPKNSQRIGINYDMSLISFLGTDNYLYILNLSTESNTKYKATPFMRSNFVTSAFTGILTGEVNSENNTVEVITTIPPEYKVDAEIEVETDNTEISTEL